MLLKAPPVLIHACTQSLGNPRLHPATALNRDDRAPRPPTTADVLD